MARPIKKPWQHPPIRSPATGEAGKWQATQGRDIFTPIADMDADDTAHITLTQGSGTSQTDINVLSTFSGFLAC